MKPFTFLALMGLSLSVFTGCTPSQEEVTPQPTQARSTAGARLSVPRIVRDLVIRERSTGVIVGSAEEATYDPQAGRLTFTTAQGSFGVSALYSTAEDPYYSAGGYTITDKSMTIKKTSFFFSQGPSKGIFIYDPSTGDYINYETDFYEFVQ